MAICRISSSVTHIAERYAYPGISCDSQLLDFHFCRYLEEWHRERGVRLSKTNLEHYVMNSFRYTQKTLFTGNDTNDGLFFECYDTSGYGECE